jgi:mono/diheme cytochrome c family protein
MRVPTLRGIGMSVLAVLVAIQVVPYGRRHANPGGGSEPAWDSATTRALASRACFDCHSNETKWPAYAHVAPASWLVQHDVEDGRAALNFSEWDRPYKEAGEAAEVVRKQEMPPLSYLLMHRDARMTVLEREQLARGLAGTIGAREVAERER